jgi:hypothetical protein
MGLYMKGTSRLIHMGNFALSYRKDRDDAPGISG